MIDIIISKQIKTLCPKLAIAAIDCKIINSVSSDSLWSEFMNIANSIKSQYKLEDINKRLAILATREAYKKTGKDPNRYRPSSEALCRRIVKDMPLYKINTIVDIINLVSVKSGYSIGGFDADNIKGDSMTLEIGTGEEIYEGIGRGLLNIDGLPVYRDACGGIGTPTSDNERTKLSLQSSHILMIINGYSGFGGLQETVDFTMILLKKYASATDIQISIIH